MVQKGYAASHCLQQQQQNHSLKEPEHSDSGRWTPLDMILCKQLKLLQLLWKEELQEHLPVITKQFNLNHAT